MLLEVINGLALVSLVLALLQCLKIKSSRKNPEFAGTAGTVIRKNPDEDQVSVRNSTSRTTPSRNNNGERKLPEIPRNVLNSELDNSSEFYDTIGSSNTQYPPLQSSPTTPPPPPPQISASSSSTSESSSTSSSSKVAVDDDDDDVIADPTHPYAKVKKRPGHPYATVDESDDGGEDDLARLRPPSGELLSRSSRAGSTHRDEHFSSRQATPLPPEPDEAQQQAQQVQQHFSGDSQDSSKGYTSISVREPISHIVVSRPPPPMPPPPASALANATYATVSETSDEMYAAIEDPTYNNKANSQSNSDTYAVIDLPDDYSSDPRGRPQQDLLQQQLQPRHQTQPPLVDAAGYTRVDKSRKLNNNRPMSTYALEELYAKVQKRPRRRGPEVEAPPPPPLPPPPPQQDRVKTRSSASAAADWKNRLLVTSSSSKSADYSDFEVSRFDSQNRLFAKEKGEESSDGYETLPADKLVTRKDSSVGYETLPSEKLTRKDSSVGYEILPAEKLSRKDSSVGYETLPDKKVRRTNSGNYETVQSSFWMMNELKASHGYETLKSSSGRGGSGKDGYETVKSNKDGYETVKSNKDGYETVKSNKDGYETVKSNKGGYETVTSKDNNEVKSTKPKEPPYAKLLKKKSRLQEEEEEEEEEEEDEEGYETIPGVPRGVAINSDYDPAYEVLSKAISEPAYETIESKTHIFTEELEDDEDENVGGLDLISGQSSLIHMSVQEPAEELRKSSVVVIEHVEVSDVELPPSQQQQQPEINTHIFV